MYSFVHVTEHPEYFFGNFHENKLPDNNITIYLSEKAGNSIKYIPTFGSLVLKILHSVEFCLHSLNRFAQVPL